MRLTQLGQASYLPHPEAAGASSVSGGRQGAWSISSVQEPSCRAARRCLATAPRAGRSPTITPVGFGKWLRGIFSSGEFDDEAALREEYNLPERSEDEFQRDRLNSFTGAGESTAEEELDDHQPPPDPA